jgi:hypothetical protein
MFNLILNTVEKKSFLIGASIASAVWLFVIIMLQYNTEPVIIYGSPPHCEELPADSANVYILSIYKLRGAEEQRVIDSVVFAVSNEYNFDDSDREYLHTLITD